jgi:transcriptional regulator with XRE-family HTH domain
MASTRAPVEHHAYNTNAEFANFRPYRHARYRRRKDAGFGFAIRDCAYDLYTQQRCAAPVIVAAAIVNVIRRRAANQFRKSGMLLTSQPGIAQKRRNYARIGGASFYIPAYRALNPRQLPVGSSEFDDYSVNGILHIASAIATPLLQMAVAVRSPWRVGMPAKPPNPVDRHVGSRVRMRRIMLGISQEKLGEGLGLTFQQIQKYEKGTNRIGASRIHQISEILQVPVSFLFEGSPSSSSAKSFDEAPSAAYVADFLATSEGLALIRAFTRIPNIKLRRAIVDMVELIGGPEEANSG